MKYLSLHYYYHLKEYTTSLVLDDQGTIGRINIIQQVCQTNDVNRDDWLRPIAISGVNATTVPEFMDMREHYFCDMLEYNNFLYNNIRSIETEIIYNRIIRYYNRQTEEALRQINIDDILNDLL